MSSDPEFQVEHVRASPRTWWVMPVRVADGPAGGRLVAAQSRASGIRSPEA